MKKLFLSVLFLMISLVSFSQTFVEKYNSAISKKADVFGDWQDVSLTVVFNEKETGDIVFYYSNGTTRRFHRIGEVEKGKTTSGESYQIISCIDNEDGVELALQLFDNTSTLRLILEKGYFIEFHK